MRRTAVLPLALAAVLALGACGSSGDDTTASAAPSTTASADVGDASAVTPVDDATLAAAEDEGEVLAYVNAEDQQMAPIKKAFEAAYPGITLRSLTLGDEEAFQRYETELATGAATADLMMNSDLRGWVSFLDDGNVEDYEDPNSPNLPDYANLAPGVYAASTEPVIAVFNKQLLPEDEQPTTLAGLADMAEELDGRLATTDIGNAIQFGSTAAMTGAFGEDAWETIETLGAHSKVESSNGPLVTKLAQGQYAANFFVSGSVRAFLVDDVAKIVNYRYLEDGTPLIPRAMGVTAEAAHPNAAKVFMNWLLSVEGQEAACAAGFTAYRDGVTCELGLAHVIAAIGGEENLVPATLDESLATDGDALVARWNEAFGR